MAQQHQGEITNDRRMVFKLSEIINLKASVTVCSMTSVSGIYQIYRD